MKLSTTMSKKFEDILRRHAYIMRLNQNEVLELYQNAYLEILNFEKGKNHCHQCEQKIKKFEEVRGILCQSCVK